MKIVVKIGGAALEDKDTLKKCAQAVVQLSQVGCTGDDVVVRVVGIAAETIPLTGITYWAGPATATTGTGHHAGCPWKPSSPGSVP